MMRTYPVRDYRIYYADGTTYSGDPADSDELSPPLRPYSAPAWGVLVIVEVDPEHGRRLVTGKDYYIWDDGRWWSVDQIGMIDYLARPGCKRVLFGRTVDNESWYEAMRRANDDPDFPARTAWGALEEKL